TFLSRYSTRSVFKNVAVKAQLTGERSVNTLPTNVGRKSLLRSPIDASSVALKS
ncbi:hypothetical protein LINGRAPRIM_LOCUS2376, partial [Linum grandiflorum]